MAYLTLSNVRNLKNESFGNSANLQLSSSYVISNPGLKHFPNVIATTLMPQGTILSSILLSIRIQIFGKKQMMRKDQHYIEVRRDVLLTPYTVKSTCKFTSNLVAAELPLI